MLQVSILKIDVLSSLFVKLFQTRNKASEVPSRVDGTTLAGETHTVQPHSALCGCLAEHG